MPCRRSVRPTRLARVARRAALILLLAIAPLREARALTVIGEFFGGTPPETTSGTGDVDAIFRAAAGLWERAIFDPHTVTITYSWSFLGSDTLGVGVPGDNGARPSTGIISLSNSMPWYLDPTPDDDAEWSHYEEEERFLGGDDGPMNVGRNWFDPEGDAALGYDLFSVIFHEIGHILALGLISDPFFDETGDGDIDLSAPRPYAGASLPTTPEGGGHLALGRALMYPYSDFDQRQLISAADILAVAELNDYVELDLDPARVPEPASALLLAGGLAGLAGAAARRRGGLHSRRCLRIGR